MILLEENTELAEEQLQSLKRLERLIGNTKLHKLNSVPANLHVKLEHQNGFGSIKDRAAFYIIKSAIEKKIIKSDTSIIESTSGNFGISLANICKALQLNFIPVIDPNISREKETQLKLLCSSMIKVEEVDETGGYLLNRIKTVKKYIEENTNVFNPNQYENPNNYMAYYHTLGEEICTKFSKLDYAFISVSTGGTITGLSIKLKQKFKDITIVGVDVEGSMIFSNKIKTRRISGIGASQRSAFFDKSLIDDYVILSQHDIIKGCNELLLKHNLFLGASSGAAYYAAVSYLEKVRKHKANAVFIAPDAGHSYLASIYNSDWVAKNIAI